MASKSRKARGSRAGVRRGELTPSELESVGKVASEGFTVRVSGPGAGKPARNVFSTGFAPKEGRKAEVNIDPNLPAAQQIGEFNKQRLEDLSTPGARMGIGGWQDPETGKVGQDVSVLTPRTTSGLEAAMHLGTYSTQAAIGNLGAKKYVGDINIPKHLQRGQFAYHESEGIDPLVEHAGPVHTVDASGKPVVRNLVRITPSRKEMVGVEAELMAEQMNLPKD